MKVMMTGQNLMEILFKEKERLPRIGFYMSKTGSGDYEWGCEICVMKFADSYLVIGNYCGGGAPFCCDITTDGDESGLCEFFDVYLRDLGCDTVEGERVVYVDCAKYEGSPIPEVIVVIEDGLMQGVYSNLENLGVELIDLDVTEEEALKDAEAAMDEVKSDFISGKLYSHW